MTADFCKIGVMKPLDLTGQRFGRLIVQGRVDDPRPRVWWLCHCDCGQDRVVVSTDLKSGHTQSCGCARAKHGHTSNGETSREWRAWDKIRKRCGVAGSRAKSGTVQRGIPRYVARGMAPEWAHDFQAFLEYVQENLGPHPGDGWSIDRVDNDRGYVPGNIRWMPLAYQRRQGGRTTAAGKRAKRVE